MVQRTLYINLISNKKYGQTTKCKIVRFKLNLMVKYLLPIKKRIFIIWKFYELLSDTVVKAN